MSSTNEPETVEPTEDQIKQAKLLMRIRKRTERVEAMKQQMEAASTFKRLLVYLRFQWLDLLLLQLTIILTGTVLGVTAKVVWDIWGAIFSVSVR